MLHGRPWSKSGESDGVFFGFMGVGTSAPAGLPLGGRRWSIFYDVQQRPHGRCGSVPLTSPLVQWPPHRRSSRPPPPPPLLLPSPRTPPPSASLRPPAYHPPAPAPST